MQYYVWKINQAQESSSRRKRKPQLNLPSGHQGSTHDFLLLSEGSSDNRSGGLVWHNGFQDKILQRTPIHKNGNSENGI